MVLNMYITTNLLSGLSDGLMCYKTDKLASVEIASALHSSGRDLNEYVLKNVGTFDNETLEINPFSCPSVVSWDCRRFAEVKADAPIEKVSADIADIN